MIVINRSTVLSDEGRIVHRKETEHYGRVLTLYEGETVENFEEVDQKPPFTKEEYDAKVARFIRQRYSEDEENALKSKLLNALLHPEAVTVSADGQRPKEIAQWDEFSAWREQCKLRAMNPAEYVIADPEENEQKES